tara:strand:+ start:572 stop:718 length:147 start_codon:yes stop_codon:yes gene_type:complete
MWAVQILPLGELARKPEGRMKKLPTAPEDLMKSLRDAVLMVIQYDLLV